MSSNRLTRSKRNKATPPVLEEKGRASDKINDVDKAHNGDQEKAQLKSRPGRKIAKPKHVTSKEGAKGESAVVDHSANGSSSSSVTEQVSDPALISTNSTGIQSTSSKATRTVIRNPVSEVSDMEDFGKKAKWAPDNWEKILDFIRIMRANRDAPVDTMGCERTMEENVEPKVRRYQALVSLMLSSQTKDEVTFAAMDRLKEYGLTVQKILDIDEGTLGKLLTPVGFWKKKASYIKRTTQILRSQYNDDIPETIEGLCALPGVGPKMGYIALSVGWGKHSGIGVDTHVHRISNRLGWVGPKGTKSPEQTRIALEGWLPSELWQDFNILLVGFGQTICTPTHPKCPSCLANQLCPSASEAAKSKSKG